MRKRLARELAIQSLYKIEMTGATLEEALGYVIEELMHDDESGLRQIKDEVELEVVQPLIEGPLAHKEQIDRWIPQFLTGWSMDRLSRVDLEILRLAAYELVYLDDVPVKVVLNEAIELAKQFGTEDSGKFVNGVLGNLIKQLDELKASVKREA